MPDASTTVLRGGTLVAHDGAGHRILRDGDLAYAGGRITYVGPRRDFGGARVESMAAKLILPGFVSVRTNLLAAALDPLAGKFTELQQPHHHRSEEDSRTRGAQPSGLVSAALRWGLGRLLRAGVTTIVETSVEAADAPLLSALAAEANITLYHSPPIDAPRIAEFDSAPDLASEPLLKKLADAADRGAVPLTIDLGDSAFAFHHLLRTRGMTPIAWLARHGLLRRHTILSGVRCIAGMRSSAYPYDTDVPLIKAAGATLAATPLADAQRGHWPEAAALVLAGGGNVAIGVNAWPLDMLEELRAYMLAGKAMRGDHEAASARDAFSAATTGGASALGRDDIGRLATGARADIVIVDFDRLRIGPVFDPVRSLIACADSEMIERVIVGGRDAVRKNAKTGTDHVLGESGKGPASPETRDRLRPPRIDGTTGVTVIEGGTVIAFDGVAQRPLADADVAFDGDRIVHVGGRYAGQAARRIDARGRFVIPGLISTHAHIGCHGGDRLLLDHGRRDLQRTGFLNVAPPRLEGGPAFSEPEDVQAACRFGLSCLLKSGVTTVVEMGGSARDGGATLLAAAAESGVRLYYAPAIRGGSYRLDREGRVHRLLDERAGFEGLARAAEFIARHDGSNAGRLRGLLVLDEFFNSTPALLTAMRAEAGRLGVGMTLHFAEQVYEFHECVARTGRTPVQFLDECGFLGADVILGHCLYVTGHRFADRPGDGDLELLARSGASIAHSPVAVARRGAMLESFRRYRDHGVRIALGTDSYPLDLIAEMRWACLLGRVMQGDHSGASADEAFAAATLGGADALRRPDLGRLAPGAKADIVIVRMDAARFGVVSDPIAAFVHGANPELVERVFIDGRPVLEDGRIVAWPEAEVLAAARESTARVWEAFPRSHWSGRPAAELYPPSFSEWQKDVLAAPAAPIRDR